MMAPTEEAQALVLTACAMVVLASTYLLLKKKKMARRRRRWWVRPDIRYKQDSEFAWFLRVRQTNHEEVFKFLCLEDWQFQHLLDLVRPHLEKHSKRASIPAEMRLAMTLRCLSEGLSPKSVAVSWRVGRSTAQAVFNEALCCDVLWRVLSPVYVPTPSGSDWEIIAECFWDLWQFPNCVGAIDGKHVSIKAPPGCGSEYYCYKNFHSLVLRAACDAQYRFTWVDFGGYGSRSDGGLFAEKAFGAAVLSETLPLPTVRLPNSDVEVPCCFVADAAFPLHPNIMPPYPDNHLTDQQRVFNYRLSRARRTIENAFGIMVVRWQILRNKIEAEPKVAEKIVLAAVALHNFCMYTGGESSRYVPRDFVDVEVDGVVVPGGWREILRGGTPHQNLLPRNLRGNFTQRGHQIRERLSRFFTENAPLEWQEEYINVGRGFFVE